MRLHRMRPPRAWTAQNVGISQSMRQHLNVSAYHPSADERLQAQRLIGLVDAPEAMTWTAGGFSRGPKTVPSPPPALPAALPCDRRGQEVEQWIQAMQPHIINLTAWPCDAAKLTCRLLDRHAAKQEIQADFARLVGASPYDVAESRLRDVVATHKVQAALLHDSDTLLVVVGNDRAQGDNWRGAVFRQLVRLAQRQRFPEYFATTQGLLAEAYSASAKPTAQRQAMCARAADRMLLADAHVEYLAARVRPELFPQEGAHKAAHVWEWLVDLMDWVAHLGDAHNDAGQRAVAMFDRMMQTPLTSDHPLVGKALLDAAFTQPCIAELMTHGRWDYPLQLPYGGAFAFNGLETQLWDFRLYKTPIQQQEMLPPHGLIDPQQDRVAAGQQRVAAGYRDEGYHILNVPTDRAALTELATLANENGDLTWHMRALHALKKLDA